MIGYALLFLLVFGIVFYNEVLPEYTLKMYLFYGLLSGSIPFVFFSFKDIKWDRWIGELSFSIYIGHHLIVMLLHDVFFKQKLPMKYYGYTTIILSFVFAILIYQYLVLPIEKRRQRDFRINTKI